ARRGGLRRAASSQRGWCRNARRSVRADCVRCVRLDQLLDTGPVARRRHARRYGLGQHRLRRGGGCGVLRISAIADMPRPPRPKPSRTAANEPTVTYPIRAVSLMTGVSIDTLRAWERRYAVVNPVRDDRGRVYSEADVRRIGLLRDAVE